MIPVVALVVVGLIAALTLTFYRFLSANTGQPVTVEWMETLSVDRYRPMLRLLEQNDLAFLKSQPGYKAEMAKRMRRQRCRIFKDYLRHLESDFQMTCAALKLIMLHAQNDRPDLATTLLRSQLAFAAGTLQVRWRLVLYRYGLGSVDVSGLVKAFDLMQLELRSMAPDAA